MGRIKTQLAKRLSQKLISRKGELFSTDFEKNKELVAKSLDVPSKKIRNVIAGYISRLVKNR
ncbi:MAG: 30S ribosomal protein S17e [Nanoarchaeota archaeon]|nr:30S ribosomal protein S17e [Nanoarchaeota archaeon]MBU1029716.1 30S ribosomal protein S17e [Nanoarchaeota archaeon]MBU1850121.1 30S ribosomal protein S17e [Nanoarchaeota archaeon]